MTNDSKPLSNRSKPGARMTNRQGFVPAEAARLAEAMKVPGLPARLAAAHILAGLLPKIAIQRIHPTRKRRTIMARPKRLNDE